ncbi:MAG: 6-bladed beta-propeller [Gemmatimonadetes bacterium]|nr:6-bladed beta-propeller [Gemmatimonadota bacterium]
MKHGLRYWQGGALRHQNGVSIRLKSVIIGLILVCGCDRNSISVESQYSVRDSAGVELVVTGGPARPSSFLSYHERLRITEGSEGTDPEPLFRVGFVRVDEYGRIYVVDASNRIRVFDEGGRFVRALGGPGEGPGEFRSIIEVLVRADTVAVNDLQLGRVTRFSVVSGNMLDVQTTRSENRLLLLYALLPGGWLGRVHERKPPRSGLARDTMLLRRFRSTIAGNGSAKRWEAQEGRTVLVPTQWIHYMKSGSWKWGPLWTPVPSFGVDAAGNLYVSHGVHYEVQVYDPELKPTKRIVSAHAPVPITADLIDRYAEAIRRQDPKGPALPVEQPQDASESSKLSRTRIPHGEAIPALGRVLVGPDGALWIERPDLADDPVALESSGFDARTYWDILDPTHRYVGTVALPSHFSGHAVKGLSVYGVGVDQDNVESVVVYSVKLSQN